MIVKQYRQAGQPIPDEIRNKPVLNRGLELYLEAFFALDSERSQGFSPGRIPWHAVHFYAQVNGFDPEQTDDLFYFINAMDAAHLERISNDIRSSGKD